MNEAKKKKGRIEEATPANHTLVFQMPARNSFRKCDFKTVEELGVRSSGVNKLHTAYSLFANLYPLV